jgi:hypothetical protein
MVHRDEPVVWIRDRGGLSCADAMAKGIWSLVLLMAACQSETPTAALPAKEPVASGVLGGGGCSYTFEAPEPKFEPTLRQAFDAAPAARRVFVVLVNRVEIAPLPECMGCGNCRTCPERDAALADLMSKIDDAQSCPIAHIKAVGGEFLESFWLGNSVLARLTREQAMKVASLTDVQNLGDGDAAPTPPP